MRTEFFTLAVGDFFRSEDGSFFVKKNATQAVTLISHNNTDVMNGVVTFGRLIRVYKIW